VLRRVSGGTRIEPNVTLESLDIAEERQINHTYEGILPKPTPLRTHAVMMHEAGI